MHTFPVIVAVNNLATCRVKGVISEVVASATLLTLVCFPSRCIGHSAHAGLLFCCYCWRCSEPWLHACLNLLHWKLRELDPEGLAAVSVSLVKLGVIISNGPWLENYISATSSRLSGMVPDTQANLLSSLAVWKAQLSPAWLAMFQLMCVQQAESGSMKADTLEQVRGAI
jgi:hypothetical protein